MKAGEDSFRDLNMKTSRTVNVTGREVTSKTDQTLARIIEDMED
jgi:hypothetical protein